MRAGQPGADVVIDERRSDPAAEREFFTEWAQGKGGEIYPENVGKLVMPGTKADFRIHYHAVGEEITDTMEVAWWFHPKGEDAEVQRGVRDARRRRAPAAPDSAQHRDAAPGR